MRRTATKEAKKLLEHSRRSCTPKLSALANHRVVDLRVETHIEARAELDCAEDAHRIFPKADVWITDRTQQVLLEVSHATDEVDHLSALEVVEQAVDCEIAADRILVWLSEDVVVGDQQIGVLALGDRPAGGDQAHRLGPGANRNLLGDFGLDDLEMLRRVAAIGRDFDDLTAGEQDVR